MSTLLDRVRTTTAVAPTVRRRTRPLLGYGLLALLAYVPPLLTARGRVAADTKQYLYLDPGRLLARAVSMWDPNVGMGTVTHQTIGYVFPMGPYYWIADKLGLPDWVSQRLWLGSMLFFAAAGMLYLLRTFGLRGPGIVVAALAYMLSPYVLDYAARISVLLLPWAALPWMIGVIRKALRAPARGLASWRYPAIFALIVQVIGGVNATALLFAGLGPVLWILYAWLVARDVTFRRALSVTARTGVLTLLASLWWIAGLRMQAAYGLDILRYTETVDAVARTSTPNEVLRGLGYWFFYGQDRLGPWIEAATTYTQVLRVILAGYILVALALFGAAFVRWRHRVYFIALLTVGVVIAVGAHPYKSPTPLGRLFESLASSSTAALAMRSTGRAVPLVVLALAVFLGLTTNVVSERLRERGGVAYALAAPAVVVALLAVNFPALYDGSYYGKNLQRPEQIPSYWKQAIASLGNSSDSRVLEAPGSDFASYRWGNTVDPITPGLTDRPYVARELIPYGTAGSADLLNALDRRLQEGVADPRGIAPLLRRMGVGDLLARNDIEYERYDLVPPRELARVLAGTPGLAVLGSYGTPVRAVPVGVQDETSLAAPPNEAYPSPVVVYGVEDPVPIVRAESTDHALMVSGDGEGLVDVADVGLLDQAGVVRYSASYTSPGALRAATNPGAVLVITDNNRLRARRWTSVKDNVGYTEQAGAADRPLDHDSGDARLPLFPNQQPSAYTTTVDLGVQRAVASAYGNTITYTPEDRASRALDGDPYTSWRANAFGDARGQRLRIDLERPITTDHVNLVQPLTGGRNRWITNVDLRLDGGPVLPVTLDPSSRTLGGQTVAFGRHTFQHLEVTVTQTSDHATNLFGKLDAVGFAEIRLRDEHSAHDVTMQEVVQMPTDLLDALGPDAATHPIILVMRRDAVRPVPPRSQPELSIDRRFTLPVERTFVLTGDGEITPDASAAVLQAAFGVPDAAHGGVSTSWSQFLFGCMKCTANSAIDGDPQTAWQTPFIGVRGEWMQFASATRLSFDHMDMRVLADGRHSVPTVVQLDVDGRTRVLRLPDISDQAAENASAPVHLTFPAVTGHTVRVTVLDVREERSRRFATSATDLMPVGIAELGIPGLHLPPAPRAIDSGCRSDLLAMDGTPLPVRLTGRAATADRLMALTVTPCDPRDPARVPTLTLGAGAHTLTSARGKDVGFMLDRLVLASGTVNAPIAVHDGVVTRVGAPAPSTPRLEVVRNGRTSLRVHVSGATAAFWMVLGESQSSGWHANVIGGRGLGAPQLVDGYANGWLVTPAAASFDIAMEWTPQRQVRAALWISLLAALTCLVIAGLTTRRRVLAGANTAAARDADVDVVWRGVWDRAGVRDRHAWIAPVLAGVVTAITVAPWVGLLVAGLLALVQWRPALRVHVLVLPAAILFLCGAYIAVLQARHRYPPVFEWPTVFGHARTPAWIAVMILLGDAIAQVLRGRGGGRARARGSDEGDPP